MPLHALFSNFSSILSYPYLSWIIVQLPVIYSKSVCVCAYIYLCMCVCVCALLFGPNHASGCRLVCHQISCFQHFGEIHDYVFVHVYNMISFIFLNVLFVPVTKITHSYSKVNRSHCQARFSIESH